MRTRPLVRALLPALILLSLAATAARAAAFDPAQMPTLWQGARGAAVTTLQAALNDWGGRHGRSPLLVDGDFGPVTRQAVVSYQWSNGLYPDGVVGPLTWRALAAMTGGVVGPARNAEALRQQAAWTRAGMPGRYSVTNMAANGGRPVAVWLPAGFDAALPARLVTYFHGHGGNVGEAFAGSGVLARLRDRGARYRNTIFVCPQAASAPFSYWMRAPGESFARLERDALTEARRLAGGGALQLDVRSRIVSAHSGGGLALRNAVTAGEFRADHIEFLDCTYGDWGQVVVRWALARPAATRPYIEAWHTPGSTATNDAAIARMAPAIVTIHASSVGHGAIPGRFLGTALEY